MASGHHTRTPTRKYSDTGTSLCAYRFAREPIMRSHASSPSRYTTLCQDDASESPASAVYKARLQGDSETRQHTNRRSSNPYLSWLCSTIECTLLWNRWSRAWVRCMCRMWARTTSGPRRGASLPQQLRRARRRCLRPPPGHRDVHMLLRVPMATICHGTKHRTST